MSIHSRRILMGCTAVAALLVTDMVQMAQAAVDELVVTSQRRAQSITDVPIAVTAFDANMIQKMGINEAKDYLAMTPNVSFSESGQAGNRSVSINIRGVGNVDLGEVTSANSIGYYLDELSVGNTANGVVNPQLYDMEGIEVLRGPQGTYFGRNAAGGALNIRTKLPTDEFEGSFEATYGSFDTWGFNSVLNVPFSEKVMSRFVLSYEEGDGVTENVNPTGSDPNYEHMHVRGALRAMPTDSLTVDLSVSYTDEDQGADDTVATGVLDLDTKSIFGDMFIPVDSGIGFYPSNDDKFDHDREEFNNSEFLIVNLRAQLDFDRFMVRSITGLVDTETERKFDQDNIFTDTVNRDNLYEGESISQEIRFQSTGDWGVDWIVGGLYAEDTIEQFNSITAGADGSFDHPNIVGPGPDGLLPPIPPGFRINENNRKFETESWAIFADLTWHATEQIDVIVGGRFSHDEVSVRQFDTVAFEGAVPDVSGKVDFDNFTPRLVVSWDINDSTNIYASASAGYKAGGLDPDASGKEFDEEKLWSYEVGIKGDAADGRVRYSAAAFLVDWEDMQVQSNFLAVPGDISSAVESTLNAESAQNWGLEGELIAELTDNLTLQLGAGYIDSEFEDFKNAVLSGGAIVDVTGQRLPGAPEWTYNAALDYRRPLSNSDLEGFARAELFGRSESRSNIEAVAAPILGLPDFPYESPSFTVVNLRFGVETEQWGVDAFVENLFEEDYYTSSNDNFGISGMRVRPHPRVLGVRGRVNF